MTADAPSNQGYSKVKERVPAHVREAFEVIEEYHKDLRYRLAMHRDSILTEEESIAAFSVPLPSRSSPCQAGS